MLIYFIERHTKYRPLANCPISPRQNPKPGTRNPNLLHVIPCLYVTHVSILNVDKCPNLTPKQGYQAVKILCPATF